MKIENTTQTNKRAAQASLLIGVLLLIAKFVAYFITGSSAIFSDASESVVNIFATSMALFSIILSSKPADESHLYGHGNIEYFSAGIEGMLIFLAAIVIIYQAIYDILKGPELKSLSTGIIIIAAAGGINLLLGLYLIKTGKRTDSLPLIADGKHILTDSYTSFGVMIGIILVIITEINILDPMIAIFVALNILTTGYKLIRVSIGGLMLETDPKILKDIADTLILFKKDYWIDLHELRYWKSGNQIFMDFHLILPFYFNIQQTHTEDKEIDEKLREKFPNPQIKIHFDYCRPELCKFCGYDDCDVRKESHSIQFNWDVKKLTGDAVFKIHS
ncbi:cadmium, cobalt and zinc/H(+)-K(+) antiporter [bacterium BMS3Abin03]|nr:cadmium, cobalt and zinc/H(+)-K(+) antiporter [bacterium BMS3Abin03]